MYGGCMMRHTKTLAKQSSKSVQSDLCHCKSTQDSARGGQTEQKFKTCLEL